jgi:hypothetical protein
MTLMSARVGGLPAELKVQLVPSFVRRKRLLFVKHTRHEKRESMDDSMNCAVLMRRSGRQSGCRQFR